MHIWNEASTPQVQVNVTLNNILIAGNSSQNGGGIKVGFACNLILNNVTMMGNHSDYNGGAIYNGEGDLNIINSTSSTDNVGVHCDSYTWTLNGNLYNSSNKAC